MPNRRSDRIGPVTVLAGALLLFGCAPRAMIRTSPPGARAIINDRVVGTTPVAIDVNSSRAAPPVRYRLELNGYQPLEGQLQPSPAQHEYTFVLQPLPRGGASSGDGAGIDGDTIPARLRRLEILHDRGEITDEEYRVVRGKLLGGD